MSASRGLAAGLAALALAACAGTRPSDLAALAAEAPAVEPAAVQATSLLGQPLPYRPPDAESARVHEAELDGALAALRADPEDEAAWVWAGRRLAYLGRYRGALAVFDMGLAVLPGSAALLRHRGHRLLTVRELERAERDLARAAELLAGREDEVEPDGLPNAIGVPRGTLGTAVHYHLGLARYLRGDFAAARDAWERCLAHSTTDDMRVAALYWLVLCDWRLGDAATAGIRLAGVTPELDVVENAAYHRLLLAFAGALAREDLEALLGAGGVQSPTVAWGLAAWDLAEGREAQALAACGRIVAGEEWAAFGFLAAEAELARRGVR